MNNIPQSSIHLSILDNCTSQNKSQLVFKFEAFLTYIVPGIFKARIKLFFKPGHSHNASDVITDECGRLLLSKDVYTVEQMATVCPQE